MTLTARQPGEQSSERCARGACYALGDATHVMATWLVRGGGETYLEASLGDGVFLEAARDSVRLGLVNVWRLRGQGLWTSGLDDDDVVHLWAPEAELTAGEKRSPGACMTPWAGRAPSSSDGASRSCLSGGPVQVVDRAP